MNSDKNPKWGAVPMENTQGQTRAESVFNTLGRLCTVSEHIRNGSSEANGNNCRHHDVARHYQEYDPGVPYVITNCKFMAGDQCLFESLGMHIRNNGRHAT